MKELDFLRYRVQHLRNVRWFNSMPCLVPMSVAEHSYMTAVIVMLMKGAENTPDMLKAALLHDIEEGFTGDLNALAKRMDSDINKAWKKLKQQVMEKVVLEDTRLREELGHFWKLAQEDPLIKAADLVSMWLYAIEEVDMGNKALRYVCYLVENWLLDLAAGEKWLQPWVDAIVAENIFRDIRKEEVPANLHYAIK